jgi:hypothetical protein
MSTLKREKKPVASQYYVFLSDCVLRHVLKGKKTITYVMLEHNFFQVKERKKHARILIKFCLFFFKNESWMFLIKKYYVEHLFLLF